LQEGEGKVACLIKHHIIKTWASGCIGTHICNLISRWRWMVSFLPWLLNTPGREPVVHCNMERRWLGPRTVVDVWISFRVAFVVENLSYNIWYRII